MSTDNQPGEHEASCVGSAELDEDFASPTVDQAAAPISEAPVGSVNAKPNSLNVHDDVHDVSSATPTPPLQSVELKAPIPTTAQILEPEQPSPSRTPSAPDQVSEEAGSPDCLTETDKATSSNAIDVVPNKPTEDDPIEAMDRPLAKAGEEGLGEHTEDSPTEEGLAEHTEDSPSETDVTNTKGTCSPQLEGDMFGDIQSKEAQPASANLPDPEPVGSAISCPTAPPNPTSTHHLIDSSHDVGNGHGMGDIFSMQDGDHTNTATTGGESCERVKRPVNSFLLFSNEYRAKILAENKDLPNSEISKMLGERWKSLSPEERNKYVEEARGIKATFEAANPDYKYTKSTKRQKVKRKNEKGDLPDLQISMGGSILSEEVPGSNFGVRPKDASHDMYDSRRNKDAYRFRWAENTDADTIVRLVNDAFQVEEWFLIYPTRITALGVQENSEQGKVLLIEHIATSEVLGCVFIKNTQMGSVEKYWGLLAVAPKVQQRGLGTHLMMEVERLAKEEGCMRVQILTVNLRPKLVGWFSKYHYIISGIKTWSEVVGNNEAVKEDYKSRALVLVMEKELYANYDLS